MLTHSAVAISRSESIASNVKGEKDGDSSNFIGRISYAPTVYKLLATACIMHVINVQRKAIGRGVEKNMPSCPRCSAENAEHMITCWRCAYPIYPPQVSDEVARKRRAAEETEGMKMLPSGTVTTAVAEEAPPETRVISGETGASQPTVREVEMKETLAETVGEPSTREAVAAVELQIEQMPPAKREQREEKVAPPAEVAPSPKVMRRVPTPAPPTMQKRAFQRFIPFVIAGVVVAVIATGVVFLLPRFLQSPQKVVTEFL
ncbi:MAG: hypothetical protein NZ781_07970, partial [Armatimonadetes bacterium]|nr:hypothetical protein [Armatimonadota bacterium]